MGKRQSAGIQEQGSRWNEKFFVGLMERIEVPDLGLWLDSARLCIQNPESLPRTVEIFSSAVEGLTHMVTRRRTEGRMRPVWQPPRLQRGCSILTP
jgi:hypothetical protein